MKSTVLKWMLGLAGLALLVVLGGAIILYVSLSRWLAGEDCRELIANLVGKELKIDGRFQPFQWSGFSVYSEGFEGQGRSGGSVRNIRAEQIRAELNFAALMRGTWEITEIRVVRLRAELGEPAGASVPADSPLASPDQADPPGVSLPFLPADFVLREVLIEQADLTWPAEGGQLGSLTGTKIDVASEGPDWKFSGKGGKFVQPGLPEMLAASYQARFKPPQYLYVDFDLRDRNEGSVSGRGQVDFGPGGKLELQVNLKRVDLSPFLTEDWRARLTGRVNGPMELVTELGRKNGMKAKGSLKLTEAKVEALPFLNTVALLTRTQEFRSLKLQTAQADFQWEKDRLAVDQIVVESELLLKVTGNYLQTGEQVEGLLQVGTTPEAIKVIPGATDKIFTVAKEGYVWTPVRLSGTTSQIEQDLTPRLQGAAVGAVMDMVPSVTPDQLNKGVDKVFDFLNKNNISIP